METSLRQQLDGQLCRLLATRQVTISQPRDQMLQLNDVPVGPDFNHPSTNVLLCQVSPSSPWQLFVDDDLAYEGEEPARRHALSGHRRRGWQPCAVHPPLVGDVNEAVKGALEWLGTDLTDLAGAETGTAVPPRKTSAAAVPLPGLLPGTGRVLGREELAPPGLEALPSQEELVLRIQETVLRRFAPRCPLVLGGPGTGRSTLARWAGAALLDRRAVDQVLEIRGAALCAGAVFLADRDEKTRYTLDVLAEQRQRTLVILEQFDLLISKSAAAATLFSDHLDRGLRLVAVARPEFQLGRFRHSLQLLRRLEAIAVHAPEEHETAAILRATLVRHPLAGEIELPPSVLGLICRVSSRRPGENPAAALGLLDAVISRAAVAGQGCIGPDDVFHAVSHNVDA